MQPKHAKTTRRIERGQVRPTTDSVQYTMHDFNPGTAVGDPTRCVDCGKEQGARAHGGPPPMTGLPLTGVEDAAPMHTFKSGARRSERMTDYSQIPRPGIKRIAQRFELGEKAYGRNNWKTALTTREDAYEFARDAFNHMMDHSLKLGNGLDYPTDDHLGAIGWAVVVLAHIEELYNCPWTELIETPAPTHDRR